MSSEKTAVQTAALRLQEDPSGESALTYLRHKDLSELEQDQIFHEAEKLAYPQTTIAYPSWVSRKNPVLRWEYA